MIKSPLSGWLGGKHKLSREIVRMIPAHECYVEPFAGAAWVLFRKEPSKSEVIKDINRDVVTLYRVVQHHMEEFVRWFKWALVSRDEFQRLLSVDPDTLTDIQRSARFYCLHRSSFAGRIKGTPSFGYATGRASRLNLLRIEEELSAAHLRLAQVYVENLSYQEIIQRYDRPRTFFYLDPPYWDCEEDYGKGIFDKSDFQTLADQLGKIKGKFLLSINDKPEIREIFREYTLHETQVTYSVAKGSRRPFKELLIRNY